MNETAPQADSALVQLARLVPDASFAMARDLQRGAFGLLRIGMQGSAAAVGAIASAPLMARPLAVVERQVQTLARQGAAQRQADSLQFAVVLQRATPKLEQLLDLVVEMLPINALLGRVDVDAVVRRVDVDALVARVDLERIVTEVLAGIEIGDLIHDSTNGIASDVRATVRVGAAGLDGRIERIVDRIVRRGRERDLVLPGYTAPGLP